VNPVVLQRKNKDCQVNYHASVDTPLSYSIAEWISCLASCMSSKKKKGRAGRRPHANSDSDWYVLCISLKSFVVLLWRLYDNPGSHEASYFKAQEVDIFDCLDMFVTPCWCQQASLEKKMANPCVSESACPRSCLDSCTFCSGGYRTLFPKLVKSGVQSVLLNLFVDQSGMKSKPSLEKELVDAI
jgi:hypothetical protein